MSLLSIRYWETISVNQHTIEHRTEIYTAHVFPLQVAFFYRYVNLLPANHATASKTELPYLSNEEHGDNLNPVFKDVLYAAFHKRKKMYYFFYAS